MARRPPSRQRLVVLLAVVLFAAAIWLTLSGSRTSSQAQTAPATLSAPRTGSRATSHADKPRISLEPGTPQRIIIQKIGLDAAVAGTGTNQAGEMDAPKEAAGVGWYRSGYLPGTLGNAVLAAHYMHTSGRGAFYRLGELEAGDSITLTTKHSTQYFTVTGSRTLAPDANTDDIFGPSQSANLNLITCSGGWDEAAGGYRQRLVVSALFQSEIIKP